MRGKRAEHFLSGIPAVVLADKREKTTVAKSLITLRAVDSRNTVAEVLKRRFWIRARMNNRKQKLLIGIFPIKKMVDRHGLWRQQNGYMVIIGYFPQGFTGDVGVHNHFSFRGEANQLGNFKFLHFLGIPVYPGLIFLRRPADKVLPGGLCIHITDIRMSFRQGDR